MGNEEWGMGNGEWRMEGGEWRMENGEWGMGNGEWRMRMGNGEWEWGMGNGNGNGEWEWGMGNDIDECANSPCLNGGTCADQVNGYVCSCQAEYAGLHCQKGESSNQIQVTLRIKFIDA